MYSKSQYSEVPERLPGNAGVQFPGHKSHQAIMVDPLTPTVAI